MGHLYDSKDDYVQLKSVDYRDRDNCRAVVFFNSEHAFYATKASAKNGWVDTYIPADCGPMESKELAKKLLSNGKKIWLPRMYLTRDRQSVMVVRLYGEVVIIKLDKKGNPVKNG